VKEGPSQLNLEMPAIGKNKLVINPRVEVKNIPNRQYLIWSLPIPIDLLKVLIRNRNPMNIYPIR
jgi:hypothetical protein